MVQYAAAVAALEASILAIPDNGLANGDAYCNTAMPSTSHVRSHLLWPIEAGGTARSVTDHVCRYSRVDLNTAARTAEPDKAEIEVGVIIAIARCAAWRFYHWNKASLNVAEIIELTNTAPALVVHTDHEAAVASAMQEWAAPAARLMGLFYYNSISYEVSAHNHLPAVTKKLSTTTITMLGLKVFFAAGADREGSIMHDTFHALSDTEKSNAARRVAAKDHLSSLKLDNLRKRIPVKAPDSGIALNYTVLYRKASAYHHDSDHLPDSLAPPANVAIAIAAYEAADTAAAVTAAVTKLRALSDALTEPSAYLAGFILGREASAADDNDLDLKTAARTTTILGSPAYRRAAGEFSGTFTSGKANGFAKIKATVKSQVLPRCAKAVTAAGVL